MLSAGQRNQRVRFERRVEGAKTPSGNVLEDWTDLGSRWAAFRPQFGREKLAVAQLQDSLTGTLTVLACPVVKAVTGADRVVFVAGPYTGRTCQIRSIVPTPDGAEVEFLLENSPQL